MNCATCGNVIPQGAQACPYCGAPASGGKFCEHCGSKL